MLFYLEIGSELCLNIAQSLRWEQRFQEWYSFLRNENGTNIILTGQVTTHIKKVL